MASRGSTVLGVIGTFEKSPGASGDFASAAPAVKEVTPKIAANVVARSDCCNVLMFNAPGTEKFPVDVLVFDLFIAALTAVFE